MTDSAAAMAFNKTMEIDELPLEGTGDFHSRHKYRLSMI